MEGTINPILEKIYADIFQDDVSDGPSLYGGRAGLALFELFYLSYMGGRVEGAHFESALQRLSEEVFMLSGLTLSNGIAGVCWFFSLLERRGILDSEDLELLCSRDVELKQTALRLLASGVYDPLHGATGIGYYLLYRERGREDEGFFQNFFSGLDSLINVKSAEVLLPRMDFTERRILGNEVDFGVAHGITGVLKFCIQCCRQGVCYDQAAENARRFIDYLMVNANADTSFCFFPSVSTAGVVSDGHSRLGWCYGDLGIAFILYQAGVEFGDSGLKEFSLAVLRRTAGRRAYPETRVMDSGLCHGSAGIAYLYRRIWRYTGESVFRDAGDFWMQQAVQAALTDDPGGTYMQYLATTNSFVHNAFFLEGAAGIGLVLLDYLKPDGGWDYCLFLND